MLEFIPRFHGLIYTRLLNTEWHRLKLADHEQMQRKVDQACNSIKLLIENIIEETRGVWNLIMAILTVTMLCPWHTTLSFILVYKAFFLGYVRQHGGELLKLRTESNKTSEQLHQRHSLVAGRILDYVLHCEQTAMITNTASFKVALERLWYTVDYAANRLSFVEELLGKTCTLIVISVVLIHTTNTPLMVIPVCHYLSSLVNQLDTTNQSMIRYTRLIKEYDLIVPMLNECEPRLEAPQFAMRRSLTIHTLHFAYENHTKQRTRFELKLSQPLIFQNGEVVLVTGNSGAGTERKSTFYDILSGCISSQRYHARITIDGITELPNEFHNIESLRTFVLQDTQMDFSSSIYTMITDCENDYQQAISQEDEERIWYFLRLVEIDSFVQENFDGQLDRPVENQLSGGQKTRLMLARALNRAQQRQSRILILDEPDQGLPSETTFRIMPNIVRWFKSKGILFLTLHNDRVRERLFVDHLLHIDHGHIQSIPFDHHRSRDPLFDFNLSQTNIN
ncbi:unnamed protein product [Rotaria sp. Silwood2]|nr:unnamed protein product [Rotaria sp. Silwood2]